MRLISKVTGVAALLLLPSAAAAIPFIGTPSPSLFPRFGTLINFDDRPTLSLVGAADYLAQGVSSVTELEGLGRFARYPSSQSLPNYIGTGTEGERDTDSDAFGFDGTIRFHLAKLQAMVGIGIAETPGADLPLISIFDANLVLLETLVPAFGVDVYVGFTRNTNDIAYLQVRGDGFALDDLQFTQVPEPRTVYLLGLGMFALFLLRRKSVSRSEARNPAPNRAR
jgi:hypothetical protein